MTCEPTQTPDALDIAALRDKYRPEREKIRPEGQKQYLRTADGRYAPGFYAFDKLIQEWRDNGDLEGLVVET